MSSNSLLDMISTLFPIVGGIVVGGVGLLFGQWLTRGQADIFLIGVEPGKTQNTKARRIQIPPDIIEMSRKVKWSETELIETSHLNELTQFLSH